MIYRESKLKKKKTVPSIQDYFILLKSYHRIRRFNQEVNENGEYLVRR